MGQIDRDLDRKFIKSKLPGESLRIEVLKAQDTIRPHPLNRFKTMAAAPPLPL